MKRKAITVLTVLLALAVLIFSAVKIYNIIERKKLSTQAEELISAEKYEQARTIFESLGDSEGCVRCDELMLEREYQRAAAYVRQGEYEAAERIIAQIGRYKDTDTLLTVCNWLRAQKLTEDGEYMQARKIYLSIPDYPGCSDALETVNARLAEKAIELACDFKMEEACEIWRELGSYGDSAVLLERGKRIIDWAERRGAERLTDPSKKYKIQAPGVTVYQDERCYIVVPEKCDRDTTFFLYYPGGRNEELYIDYFLYYLMNPSPDTIAVFMRKNGLENMEGKCNEAIELLERVAAECGVFVHNIVQGGSSLGAYPAMHGALYAYNNYRIHTQCVLSLDAGSDWLEAPLLLTEQECRELAKLGVQFYLFESPWVGMNRDGIILMVETGNDVITVGCYFDDHTRITLDAMGMGVVKWATGDRREPVNPEIYTFTKLVPGTRDE